MCRYGRYVGAGRFNVGGWVSDVCHVGLGHGGGQSLAASAGPPQLGGAWVFAVCVVVTLYNHAYFFDSEKHSKGVQQQAAVAPSADVVRYEAELALIAARSLPVVSADIA